ncbi:MAG: hypothetical protein AAGC44_11595 [Planctomycetota bacterium]
MAEMTSGPESNAQANQAHPTASPSWNPLCCAGTALPPNLLLWAKITGLLLVGMGYLGDLPEPWLPTFGWPYGLPLATKLALQGVMLLAIGLLIFNRWVRACCIAIGLTLFIGMLIDRLFFSNAKTFVALMLLIVGLWNGPLTHTLLRWQYAVMYLGAAVNKLFDPDWRSGRFFTHWMGELNDSAIYLAARSVVAEPGLGRLLSWSTIGIEIVLAFLLLLTKPRYWLLAALLAAGFHGMSVLMADTLFKIYVPTLALGLTVFYAWPGRGELALTAPPESRLVRWLRRTDLDRLIDHRVGESWQLRTPDKTATGWLARLLVIVYLPAFWWVACFSAAFLWMAYLKLRTMV